MIGRLLCLLSLHRWRHAPRYMNALFPDEQMWRCERCGTLRLK